MKISVAFVAVALAAATVQALPVTSSIFINDSLETRAPSPGNAVLDVADAMKNASPSRGLDAAVDLGHKDLQDIRPEVVVKSFTDYARHPRLTEEEAWFQHMEQLHKESENNLKFLMRADNERPSISDSENVEVRRRYQKWIEDALKHNPKYGARRGFPGPKESWQSRFGALSNERSNREQALTKVNTQSSPREGSAKETDTVKQQLDAIDHKMNDERKYGLEHGWYR